MVLKSRVTAHQPQARRALRVHENSLYTSLGQPGGRFTVKLTQVSGPGSVVRIATGYGLDGLGIESRWGARFSVPVQTGPGAHPVSCTIGTGSFPGVKSGRGVTLNPHTLLLPLVMKE